jgi:PAS domain S-box-containing protein
VGGILILTEDITRRKQMEETLRESEDKLRLLLDSTAEAIYGIDLEHRCTFCNPACLRALGYERIDEVLGKNMHDLMHHSRADRALYPVEDCPIHRVTQTGKGVHEDDELMSRTDGTSFPVEYWSYPQRRGDEIVGAVVAFNDITERKLAESALAKVSLKLIEAQEQERARIARELHDDINQRLAMLGIELQQLREHYPDLPVEISSRMEELRKQTAGISNDVQALSHELHSSKLEYLGAIGGMKSWCKEFGERQGIQIEFKSTEVQTSVAPEVGLCLFRVLQEALHNAAKHSGVRRIEVQLQEDSGEIHLVISDLGRGFDLETAMQGRGLGLTSMQERVRLVNGTIEIQSKPMGGTTVHVRVPFKSERVSERAAVKQRA